ncbi:VC0807 family protein [Saccharothrix sp. HUAS TT1]|uniref:VC0807 family protein n=1 Tax=unclassified Saccharothrix TaxID=2593673 RepID=UPI00345B7E71
MSESIAASSAAPATPPGGGRAAAVLAVVWDLGLPLVAYYALHLLGASDWVALLAATATATGRLVWVALRTRQVTWFAAVMMMVFGLGLALGFLSGDPRFLLVKDSFGTAGAGLVHLISLAGARPFALAAVQTWKPAQAAEFGELYRTVPETRRLFRLSGLVWGVGLIAEAVLRLPVIYLVPVDVAVGLSALMMAVFVAAILTWNLLHIARVRTRSPHAWVGHSADRR